MCCKGKKMWQILIVVLLVCTLVVNIILFKKSALSLEILKVGGKQNWDMAKQIYTNDSYITQQTSSLDALLLQQDGEENTENLLSPAASAEIDEILATYPIHGEEDARFTILEYSELLCPACKAQSANGTIDAVLAKYPKEVNSVTIHYIIHGEAALNVSAAAECVAELKPNIYYDFLKECFATNGLDVDGLVDIATNIGVKKDPLNKCISEGRYIEKVQTRMEQGYNLFNVGGTPGNVIIDRATRRFKVVPGAYPVQEFEKIIEEFKPA